MLVIILISINVISTFRLFLLFLEIERFIQVSLFHQLFRKKILLATFICRHNWFFTKEKYLISVFGEVLAVLYHTFFSVFISFTVFIFLYTFFIIPLTFFISLRTSPIMPLSAGQHYSTHTTHCMFWLFAISSEKKFLFFSPVCMCDNESLW